MYQATVAGKRPLVDALILDQSKCIKAVADFDRENPKGKFRKKLIDWGQWQRKYSVEVVHTGRQGEEFWTWADFSDEKSKCNYSGQEIMAKWDVLKDDVNIDREGDDGTASFGLWIPKRKERFRDKIKRVSNDFLEGSKVVKKQKAADAEDLKDFCHKAFPNHTNKFFKEDVLATESPVKPGSSGSILDYEGSAVEDE